MSEAFQAYLCYNNFNPHGYIMRWRAIYVYKCLVIENKYIGR